MFRNKIIKARASGINASTSSADPTPVFESRNQTQQREKENQIISSQESTSAQNLTSQNPSRSRFLSQRQALLNATQHQQSKGKGPFEIIVFSCGLEITEIGCELQQGDPISFTRRLRVLLTSKLDYPQSTRQYIDDFNRDFKLTDEEKSIKSEKLMRGIVMSDGQKQYQTQTSLIMCLLAIKCFKDDIVKILLKRLKEYVVEKEDKAEAMIVSLILAQFKFSDQILSGELYNFMFEEFFAIFKELKTFETQEVIVQQFKELEISKQEEAGRRLVSIFEHNKQDLLQFLDIFCLMALQNQTVTDIFEIVLRFIEKDCSSNQYLPMIKYSIHYSQTVEDVIDILRDQVKWETCSKAVINDVFKIIKKSLIRDSNKTIEAWTKTVMIVNAKNDLRYIDFIMILLICDTNTETHLSAVKKIVIDKISKGLFTNSYLKSAFKIFAAIIPSISQTLLELLDGLQRAKDNQTYNFLASCYKLLFRFSGEAKIIIGSLTSFLCEKKSNLPFASSSEFKMTILNILHDISSDSPKAAADLLFNHKILLRALDISRVELTLNEHRLLMKLLSSLVYSVDYGKILKPIEMRSLNEVKDTLSEHLNMVNCKYINNPEVKIRQLGIIGTVKTISALIFERIDETEITPDHVIQPEDMPEGSIRDATRLVELIMTAADKNNEMLAMFYDEMSMELKPTSSAPRIISQTFLNWFGNETFHLVNSLVSKPVNTELIADFNLVSQFENVAESYEAPIINVPLGSMVLANMKEIYILPSLFKLTLLLETYRFNNNDAKDVAGLCIMAISLPEKFATSDDVLSDDKKIAAAQLDIYFLCCNWLRELISGFIRTTNKSILTLVKRRLKQLIKIERHLNRLLKNYPLSGYCPPLLKDSQRKSFEALTKEKVVLRPPKVRKKSEKAVEQPKKTLKIKASIFCREMENEVVLLLKEEFLYDTIRIENEKFTLTELIYVLSDVHSKLEMLFKPRNVEQKKFIDEMQAIRDLELAVLPHLTRVFEGINEQIKKSVDNIEDETLESLKVLKFSSKGFSLILQMLNMVFSSKKLQKDEKLSSALLKTLLMTDTSRLRSQELVCAAIIERYSKFVDNVRDLNGAIALIDLMGIISSLSGERHNYNTQIHEMVEFLLHQKWENDGSNFNANLEKLLSIYVNKATNVDQLEELIDEVEAFCKNNNQEKHFPSINKTNFLCMIRVYLRRTTEIINSTKSNLMSFAFWEKNANIQCKFVEAVKWQKSAMALNLFLKNFIVFLKRFNTDGMSVLRAVAKENTNSFVDLMKSIQRIRRSAHGAACELKHRKNVSISKILPSVRQQLESFHQEASIIMSGAGIPINAIMDGPLKNFNICMEDIFSQNTTVASTNGSDNENMSEEEENNNDDDSVAANMDTSDSEDESSFIRETRSRSTIL